MAQPVIVVLVKERKNATFSRGSHTRSACRTICNRDQVFCLAKFHLDRLIALKNGP